MLFVAIVRTSKFAFVEFHQKAGKIAAAQFLRNLNLALLYRVHTVLTDNGVQFANRQQDRHAMAHIFDRACRENSIEHRLTKINHPWTNGQVERMNRTIKEATVKRYHYDTHAELEAHLDAFIASLQLCTPFEDAEGHHTIRLHLQNIDKRAGSFHC